MNIINNQRYKSTEERIENALVSLLRIRKYTDISIKELCYEAGINRSSFYAHYEDINDLMIKVESKLSKEMSDIFKVTTTFNKDTFTKMFEFLYKNRAFYKAYLESNEETTMERKDFLNYLTLLDKYFVSGCSKENLVYHATFFAGGIKAMAKAWLFTGCKETSEQMSQILYDEYTSRN